MGPLRGNGKKRLVSEINVTPLVDVMLVLLIIFMVTAPMMTQGLEVDLPETTTKALRQPEEPLVIGVDKEGQFSMNGTPYARGILIQELGKLPEEMREQPVYLRADQAVAYGVVVKLMADVKAAGFDKLGMITKPEESTN